VPWGARRSAAGTEPGTFASAWRSSDVSTGGPRPTDLGRTDLGRTDLGRRGPATNTCRRITYHKWRVVVRYIALWMLGVPVTGIIVLKVLGLI
jgi:hypothetical protein